MKKKVLSTLLVYILPLMSFADDTSDDAIENTPQLIEDAQGLDSDEVALNLPMEDSLKKDLNIDETPQLDGNTQNSEIENTTTFPMETTLGYNLDNSDGKYFFQAKGSDTLNAEKNRKFDFLIKVPYLQQTTTGNTLSPKPDEFSFNFTDPIFRIKIGDEKYDISSLTMSKYQARGGLFTIQNEDVAGFSALYLTSKPTKDKKPSDNLGSSFFVKPLEALKFSSNFLYTKYTEKIPVNAKRINYTYSVASKITPSDLAHLEMEAATSNQLENKNQAYLINLGGKNKVFSYSANWVYANPNFVGKHSDKALFDSFAKYEKNKFLFKVAHKLEKNNLENSTLLDKARRDQNSLLSISYPVFKPIVTTLGLNKRISKNLLNNDGYKLDAINLKTSIPLKKYTFENVLEYGKHRTRKEDYKMRNWQNIQLFLNNKYSENNLLSLYTKLGNLLYEDIYTISYVLGTNFKMNPNKNFSLSFAYKYSINKRQLAKEFIGDTKMKWQGHYIKQDLTYTLANDHKITLSGHLNKPLSYKKEKAVLLTYTIPLNVPNINRAVNGIRNTLF